MSPTGVRRARVTRWALVTLGALLVLGGATVAVARFFGKSGSRASIVVSVVARWLAVYVLWSFAGGLALTYGLLATYYSPAFAVIGLFGALCEYRARVRVGRERGLAIFVGVQLAWLVFVLFQNGMLVAGW
ncbi:MAG: hypothetical protein AUI57_02760 [Candidatus Rokubacteria bacterium 13_1_40CM_2_68_8]|nr:MAG: hypothetical protein AUI57_02760 [Candidatus Rokubacteria bacterium 13_1_40CM_2_68_8]